MKKLLLASVLSVVITAGGIESFAHGHGKGGDKMFSKIDTNSDGAITREESTAFEAKKFGEMDANSDGKVTKEEGKAFHEKKRAEWKSRKGENSDRK